MQAGDEISWSDVLEQAKKYGVRILRECVVGLDRGRGSSFVVTGRKTVWGTDTKEVDRYCSEKFSFEKDKDTGKRREERRSGN